MVAFFQHHLLPISAMVAIQQNKKALTFHDLLTFSLINRPDTDACRLSPRHRATLSSAPVHVGTPAPEWTWPITLSGPPVRCRTDTMDQPSCKTSKRSPYNSTEKDLDCGGRPRDQQAQTSKDPVHFQLVFRNGKMS